MYAAWDIYAHRLMNLGHGHPLWGPEPSERFGEVRLGDVGYLQEGRFCFLFNAMRGADDPINSRGVPHNLVVFRPPDSSEPIYRQNDITQTQLYSKSLQSLEIAASVSSSSEAPASASAGLQYRCTDGSGALLLLKQPAHKTYLDCKSSIETYMATHLESWCDFANETLGIGLEDKDIVFVSGFTKTTVWAAAAFSDHSRGSEFAIAGGGFVPSALGEFQVSVSQGVSSIESREGPRDRVSAGREDGGQEYKYDQCIFLNYYKMKKRPILPGLRTIRAVAGTLTPPHEDADTDDTLDISSNMSASSESQESDSVGKSYDPVDEILDYILKYSTVEVACASDEDLLSLCTTDDIPNSLRTALETLAPQIVRKYRGATVGTIGQLDAKAKVPETEGVPHTTFRV